jgi:hypothetical protein
MLKAGMPSSLSEMFWGPTCLGKPGQQGMPEEMGGSSNARFEL